MQSDESREHAGPKRSAAFDAPARVRRGAEYLDDIRPGWAAEIDVHRLLMSECSNCIIGQLYGSFNLAVHKLPFRTTLDASCFGFHIFGAEYDDPPWEALADAWRSEIAARLAGSGVARA